MSRVRVPERIFYVTGVGGKMDSYYDTPGRKYSQQSQAENHARRLASLGYEVTVYVYELVKEQTK